MYGNLCGTLMVPIRSTIVANSSVDRYPNDGSQRKFVSDGVSANRKLLKSYDNSTFRGAPRSRFETAFGRAVRVLRTRFLVPGLKSRPIRFRKRALRTLGPGEHVFHGSPC